MNKCFGLGGKYISKILIFIFGGKVTKSGKKPNEHKLTTFKNSKKGIQNDLK